jgi:hypothetical protein
MKNFPSRLAFERWSEIIAAAASVLVTILPQIFSAFRIARAEATD